MEYDVFELPTLYNHCHIEITDKTNLAAVYLELEDNHPNFKKLTVDDFFDICGVGKDDRSDFFFSCIITLAKKLRKDSAKIRN